MTTPALEILNTDWGIIYFFIVIDEPFILS